MKSIKVKPGETFKLIIADDEGNEMAEKWEKGELE